METKHIPPPYVAVPPSETEDETYWEIHDGFGRTATVYGETDDPETIATVEFIVRACNAHDALVAALSSAFDSWYANARNIEKIEPEWVKQARAVLGEVTLP